MKAQNWPRICALRVADRKAWEREVRAALAKGLTNAETAEILGLPGKAISIRLVVRWSRELGLQPGRGARRDLRA